MISNFLSFYWQNVVKKWSVLLLTIPTWPEILMRSYSYFSGESNAFEKFLSSLKENVSWWWILLILLVLHLRTIFILWQENVKLTKSNPAVSLSDEYATIRQSIEKLFPDSTQALASLLTACSNAVRIEVINITLGITNHLNVHESIYSLVQDSLKNRDPRIRLSNDIDMMIASYADNISTLRAYNTALGCNSGLPNEYDLRKKIAETNNSALALLALFNIV